MKERGELDEFDSGIHKSFMFGFSAGFGDKLLLLRALGYQVGSKMDQIASNWATICRRAGPIYITKCVKTNILIICELKGREKDYFWDIRINAWGESSQLGLDRAFFDICSWSKR